jgi:hypothetical protein
LDLSRSNAAFEHSAPPERGRGEEVAAVRGIDGEGSASQLHATNSLGPHAAENFEEGGNDRTDQNKGR